MSRARCGRHASAPSGRVPTTATAGESERKPAPRVERLLIVLSVAERTLPHRDVHPRCAPCERTTGRRRRRHAIGLLDIGVPPEAPWSSFNQQPAPRRARRDDLIALPSTWVVARIAGRVHVRCGTLPSPSVIRTPDRRLLSAAQADVCRSRPRRPSRRPRRSRRVNRRHARSRRKRERRDVGLTPPHRALHRAGLGTRIATHWSNVRSPWCPVEVRFAGCGLAAWAQAWSGRHRASVGRVNAVGDLRGLCQAAAGADACVALVGRVVVVADVRSSVPSIRQRNADSRYSRFQRRAATSSPSPTACSKRRP